MMDAGRHPNITLLTWSEVEEVSGYVGNFEVQVRRKPRYVLEDKCTACGLCLEVCPITVPDKFNEGLGTRPAIYRSFPQAIPSAYVIDKQGVAPCRDACPIGQRTQGYIALIREGRFADAYRAIKEENPFPAVCGRVCNHACEESCSRGEVVDEPVNIMRLKRFVTDWAFDHPEEVAEAFRPKIEAEEQVPEPTGKKVAVVGSGPAGLTVAQDLKLEGHDVMVFEALPVAGGMMRVGIPAYRLPYDLLQREIDEIIDLGVELKLNTRVDDVVALKDDGYDAVFVAVGAHQGVRLPIPGVDLPEITDAIEFLRQVALSDDQPRSLVAGRRILILGGGGVAVDAAMTAVRLGASWVGMSCLESRETMPAHEWEIQDAQEEGIEVIPSRTFKEIASADGHVTGVRCAEINFRGFVEGRPDFDEIPGAEQVIEADVVIFAIGQRSDVSCLPDGVKVRGRLKTAAVDLVTLPTILLV